MADSVSVINETLSVWNLGPVGMGGEFFTLIPGVPCEIPIAFLKLWDGNPVLEAAFKDHKLRVVQNAPAVVPVPVEPVADPVVPVVVPPADPVVPVSLPAVP